MPRVGSLLGSARDEQFQSIGLRIRFRHAACANRSMRVPATAARKLRRYPIDAIAVAAGSFLAGLLGALFDEREFTADEIRDLLREIESDILDPERRS